jgi:hypothetical protein
MNCMSILVEFVVLKFFVAFFLILNKGQPFESIAMRSQGPLSILRLLKVFVRLMKIVLNFNVF